MSGKILKLPDRNFSSAKKEAGSSVITIEPRPTKRTVCVTSGKGGVGKSNLVVNLAISLARLGHKALILDADLSLANVDVLMGLSPHGTLYDVLRGKRGIEEIVLEGPAGVRLIPASSGFEEMADLSDVERERLYRLLSKVEEGVDIILVDTSPGLTRQGTSFALAADEVILVTTPEPPSITDAYATIRLLTSRQVRSPIKLVVNMASSPEEAQYVIQKVGLVARRSLNAKVEDAGYICFDRSVQKAVQKGIPYVLAYPHCLASYNTHRLAERLSLKSAGGTGPGGAGERPGAEEME